MFKCSQHRKSRQANSYINQPNLAIPPKPYAVHNTYISILSIKKLINLLKINTVKTGHRWPLKALESRHFYENRDEQLFWSVQITSASNLCFTMELDGKESEK
jgi:hypothetical protein